MDRKLTLVFLATLFLGSFSATITQITDTEVEDARNKLIFLAEKLLIFTRECRSFHEAHWNVETNNYFVDTLDSLVVVQANPTLVADLRVRAANEKQQVIDKLTALDASFTSLRTQIFKIAEKLRLALYAEISEHSVQLTTISNTIGTQYSDFQSTLSFVISDIELAVLLTINGNTHPNVGDVNTHLQQSKDAANNANLIISQAEALYTNAKNSAITAVDVIVSQTKTTKHVQKRQISFIQKGQAAPEDVVSAQLKIEMWLEHMISLNTKFTRLTNAMRLKVSDSFHEIFASMRELLVDEATVSNIETDNRIDGQLLELTISSLWSTMRAVFPTLNSVNYQLNNIDKNTRGELQKLRDQLKNSQIGNINSDYNTVFNTIDTNLPVTLENIRTAIAGYSGDPVIRIYLAIQVIEDSFATIRQDIESEKPLYDSNISSFLVVLDKIIADLCSGLFC
ncbi:uncharacterized protein LOC132201714 [Neocloeon triangulifer]|uniref:uncharacterized protein LOC132201714 n=1 Tax=Neocloeon triangulifer TaxID=2078957 RepID=UPI00286FA14E|nr:uncharacterized protein LOC132201714 [Neocloeon triangulifer]